MTRANLSGDRVRADDRSVILTVGHSNVDLTHLLTLLERHGIEGLVDVRSQPRSGFSPQFNKAVLERTLSARDIRYLFGGKELGGRPDDPSCYDTDGHVLYGRQSRTPQFLVGIERLETLARSSRTAIMCSEEDPARCHRHLLLARVLSPRGWTLDHIRGDGALQPYEAMADVLSRQRSQEKLFTDDLDEDLEWRSIRSVSPSAAPPSSSAR